MNVLQRWILGKKLSQRLEQKSIPFLPFGQRFEISGDRLVLPPDNKQTYVDSGYTINAAIYAIMNLILDKIRIPEWQLFEVVDESSLKKAKVMLSNKWITSKEFKEAMHLKNASLEPIKNFNLQTGKLKQLFEYPNPEETIQDYMVATCGEKMLIGDIYDWAPQLGAGANGTLPVELNWLPAHLVKIHVGNGFPMRPVGYELITFNQKFTADEVIHEKYWNPIYGVAGQQLYGMSPFKAGLKILNRMNSAIDSAAAKFQNGGLEGVFSIDGSGLDGFDGTIAEQQASALKIQMNEEYSGPTNMGKTAWSGYPVKFERTGLSPADLQIIESEKWDAIMMCNILGVPPELLGLVGKTFNNIKEATKFLITGSVMPLLNTRRATFNKTIRTKWLPGQNVYVDYSLEQYGELKQDLSEVINVTSKQIFITPNEERLQLGQEARPEPEADEVWVLQNGSRVPLADYQANVVDQQLNADALRNNIQNGNNGQADSQNGNAAVSGDGTGNQVRNGKNVQKSYEKGIRAKNLS